METLCGVKGRVWGAYGMKFQRGEVECMWWEGWRCVEDVQRVVGRVEAWRLLVSGKTYAASLTNVRG